MDRPAHFSLAYDCYTQFTSPLRRYADMTVHRVVKRALDGLTPYTAAELEPIVALNKANPKVVFVGYMRRFAPAFTPERPEEFLARLDEVLADVERT